MSVKNIGEIGYKFRKKFDAGWFVGEVVEIRPGAANDKDRRCVYEDGDIEDLSLAELKLLARKESKSKSRLSSTSASSKAQLRPKPVGNYGNSVVLKQKVGTKTIRKTEVGGSEQERDQRAARRLRRESAAAEAEKLDELNNDDQDSAEGSNEDETHDGGLDDSRGAPKQSVNRKAAELRPAVAAKVQRATSPFNDDNDEHSVDNSEKCKSRSNLPKSKAQLRPKPVSNVPLKQLLAKDELRGSQGEADQSTDNSRTSLRESKEPEKNQKRKPGATAQLRPKSASDVLLKQLLAQSQADQSAVTAPGESRFKESKQQESAGKQDHNVEEVTIAEPKRPQMLDNLSNAEMGGCQPGLPKKQEKERTREKKPAGVRENVGDVEVTDVLKGITADEQKHRGKKRAASSGSEGAAKMPKLMPVLDDNEAPTGDAVESDDCDDFSIDKATEYTSVQAEGQPMILDKIDGGAEIDNNLDVSMENGASQLGTATQLHQRANFYPMSFIRSLGETHHDQIDAREASHSDQPELSSANGQEEQRNEQIEVRAITEEANMSDERPNTEHAAITSTVLGGQLHPNTIILPTTTPITLEEASVNAPVSNVGGIFSQQFAAMAPAPVTSTEGFFGQQFASLQYQPNMQNLVHNPFTGANFLGVGWNGLASSLGLGSGAAQGFPVQQFQVGGGTNGISNISLLSIEQDIQNCRNVIAAHQERLAVLENIKQMKLNFWC